MPFCPRCGKEVLEGSSFCPSCGQDLRTAANQPPAYVQYLPSKSPALAALLALLLSLVGIWGIGHIYAGRWARGIAFLLVGLFGWIPVVLLGVMAAGLGIVAAPFTFGLSFLGLAAFVALLALVLVGVWAWHVYDAYHLANVYNAEVRRTGRAPW